MQHTEQLCDLYRLPSIVRLVKSVWLCWAGNSSERKMVKAARTQLRKEDGKSSKDLNKKTSRKVTTWMIMKSRE